MIVGCAHKPVSYRDILDKSDEVSIVYGVRDHEAALFAQRYLLKKSLQYRMCSINPYKVKRHQYFFKDGKKVVFYREPALDFKPTFFDTWLVYFRDKESSLFWGLVTFNPFVVEVDAKTGQILSAERKYQ